MPVYRSWTGCFPASRLFGRLGRSAAWHSQLRGEHRKLADNPLRCFRPCRGPRRDCPHSLSPIRRRPGLAKAARRFVRSSGDLEVSLRVQASERSVESDSVEVVCEGAMQRFNFTRSLQSSSQQPWNSYRHVQFLRSTHPLSSGYFGGTIWRSMLWPRTRFRRRSGPPSPWTECPQEPCPEARVRSSRSRSGVLGSRSTSPRDLRLRTSRASSRTASPERIPRRPSKSGPSGRIMPMEQRRKASRDLPSIRIWSTRARSRRRSSAPRCRQVRRNRRPCR